MAAQFAGDMDFGPGADIDAVVSKLGGTVTFQDFWDLESTTDGSDQIDAPVLLRFSSLRIPPLIATDSPSLMS